MHKYLRKNLNHNLNKNLNESLNNFKFENFRMNTKRINIK